MLTIGGGVPCRHADRTSIEGKDTYGGERSRQATYTAAPSRLGLPVPFSQTDAGSTELSPQALGPSRPHLTIVTGMFLLAGRPLPLRLPPGMLITRADQGQCRTRLRIMRSGPSQ